jgi:hypothetical protein
MCPSDLEDIEQEPEIEEEKESIEFWEKRQRELVTSVVDYNLDTLSNLITHNIISLSPKYQRRYRWDEKKQSKLIESFLMNVPVPPIFLNEDAYGKYSIIDGKQRLNAINNFLRGRLTLEGLDVFADINGKNFDELPKPLRTIFQTRANLRAVIILKQSDSAIKYEVFRRLNTGGVALNAQEVRNSVYPGKFNSLIVELSENKKFHKMIGIKNKEKSERYKSMEDVELVLRYFTFLDTWGSFKGSLKFNMDAFMDKSQKFSEERMETLKSTFLNTIDVVETCFGDYAFKRYEPEKEHYRNSILRSVYDAQMFACTGLETSYIQSRKDEILDKYKLLFSNTTFRQAIDASTQYNIYFRTRIQMVKDVIDGKAVIEIKGE